VPFNEDSELRELFRSEIVERADRLIDGARTFAAGNGGKALASDLYREGHTIKGTARMMSYTAIADAGKLLEEAWKAVHEGETVVTPALGSSLEGLGAALAPAIDADPATGSPALTDAVRAVHRELHGGDRPRGEKRLLESAPAAKANGVHAAETADLNGLLASIDSWAFGENIRVNAANLFRLINDICSLRVDAEALAGLLDGITASVSDPEETMSGLAQVSGAVTSSQKALEDLQTRALGLAATPISEMTNTYPQLVRYLARRAGKEIRFELVGDNHAVDRLVLESLSDPLRQLLVNSIEHGIETVQERVAAGKPPTGTLAVHISVENQRLEISVRDDGRGIDWAAVRRRAVQRGLLPPRDEGTPESLRPLLFAPNFSTSAPSGLAGDGSGLAKVSTAVDALHGSVTLETAPGEGTLVVVTVPTSRALQTVILVRAGGQTWGLPEITVLDSLPPSATADGELIWRGAPVPVVSFAKAMGLVDSGSIGRVLIVANTSGPVAFQVAEEIGRRHLAARQLGPLLEGIPHLTGAALLGGGEVVVLVDPAKTAEQARLTSDPNRQRPRVLVVDDSKGARQVVGGVLGMAGFDVDLAGSPTEALGALDGQKYDAIVMDYVMPTMDGTTLVRRVRSLGIAVPIVVMSGLATPQDQARVLAAGADAYFDKDDVRRGALAAAVRDLLAPSRSEESAG
jgi:two-component system chemotaxis sensor kinase CheA